MRLQNSSDSWIPLENAKKVPSLTSLAMKPAFESVFKSQSEKKIISIIPINLVREYLVDYIASLGIDVKYGYNLKLMYTNKPIAEKIEEHKLYLYLVKDLSGVDRLKLAFKNQKGIRRARLNATNADQEKVVTAIEQVLRDPTSQLSDEQEKMLFRVISSHGIYKYYNLANDLDFENYVKDFTVAEFSTFIKSLQRVGFERRRKIKPWELYCLLGKEEALNKAFDKFELAKKSVEEKKALLQFLLLTNNRELLIKANELFFGPNYLLDLSEADFSYWNLSGLDLRGINFSRANFTDAHLSDAILFGADVDSANFTRAKLQRVDLRSVNNVKFAQWGEADLSGANLAGIDLERIGDPWRFDSLPLITPNFYRANFSGANLNGASLAGGNFRKAIFSNAHLAGTNLSQADLRETQFDGACLPRAVLGGADLNGACFASADLQSADFSNKKERKFKNKYTVVEVIAIAFALPVAAGLILLLSPFILSRYAFKKIFDELSPPQEPASGNIPQENINFREARLQKANLSGMVLREANLEGANLTDAYISGNGTVLEDCKTEGSNFTGISIGFFRSSRPWIVTSGMNEYSLQLMYLDKPADEVIETQKLYLYLVNGSLEYAVKNRKGAIKRVPLNKLSKVHAAAIKLVLQDPLRTQQLTSNQVKAIFRISSRRGHTRVNKETAYLPLIGGNNRETLIRLWENYVAGRFLIGNSWRNHVGEVNGMLAKAREKSDNKKDQTAEELIELLSTKLKLAGKNVNRKGELYKMMDEFCRLQLNKSFEIFLTPPSRKIPEKDVGVHRASPGLSKLDHLIEL